MTNAERKTLIKELACTNEACGGQPISDGAADMYVAELEAYPIASVLSALERCRREVTRFSLPEVLRRIDDCRPGPEEAWGMLPKSEADSAVWTGEMQCAYASCCGLLANDHIAARKTFLETYTRLVATARAMKVPVQWSITAGTDATHRDGIARQALSRGLIAPDVAAHFLIDGCDSDALKQITDKIGFKPKMLKEN